MRQCVVDHARMAPVQRAEEMDRIGQITRRGTARTHRLDERMTRAAVGVGQRGKHAPAAALAIERDGFDWHGSPITQ